MNKEDMKTTFRYHEVPMYIVMGGTGEYSDRVEWPVAAYVNRADAEAAVLRLDAAARLIDIEYERRVQDHDPLAYQYPPADVVAQMEDTSFLRDYTGTHYFIYTAPLRGAYRG